MATVNLRAVWLNDAADGSDRICLRNAGALSRTPQMVGSTVRLAGGRVRSIAQVGKTTQWQVSSPYCGPTQQAWLAAHVGTPVWVRDLWGARVLGVYWSLQIASTGRDCYAELSVTVDEITP